MKTARAAVVALALVAALALALVLAPLHQAPRAAADPVDVPDGLILGDSMTARSATELTEAFPGWEIDGVPGRRVGKLIPLLREYKTAHGTVPPVLVVALGSNEQRYFRRLYQYAVDMVAPETTIIFQSVWRDPRVWRSRARKMARLSHRMQRVADQRDHTCVARWRDRAGARRRALVADGVHPTAAGRQVWVRTLREALEECE